MKISTFLESAAMLKIKIVTMIFASAVSYVYIKEAYDRSSLELFVFGLPAYIASTFFAWDLLFKNEKD